MEDEKDRLMNNSRLKEEHRFVGKREKIIKSGYRHGIVGVESPSDPLSQFYESAVKE